MRFKHPMPWDRKFARKRYGLGDRRKTIFNKRHVSFASAKPTPKQDAALEALGGITGIAEKMVLLRGWGKELAKVGMDRKYVHSLAESMTFLADIELFSTETFVAVIERTQEIIKEQCNA